MTLPHVVTGAKNSPNAAHAGHKRQLKWVDAWGIDVPPFPRGYKHSGVAQHVGGKKANC